MCLVRVQPGRQGDPGQGGPAPLDALEGLLYLVGDALTLFAAVALLSAIVLLAMVAARAKGKGRPPVTASLVGKPPRQARQVGRRSMA